MSDLGDVIEAGDVTLRPWLPADVAFVYAACQDHEIQRWTTVPRPYRAIDAVGFVRAHARPQPEPTGAWFAITRTETSEVLGSISFTSYDEARGVGEIGYWLGPEGRGVGAAAQSLAALADWGVTALGLTEVVVRIARANLASQAVARRAGFVADGVEADGCVDGDRTDDALRFVRSAQAR